MKTKLFLLLCTLAPIMACQQPKPVSVDLNAEKAAVIALLDKWQTATQTDTLASLMTDDARVAGTDPDELWSKKEMVDMWHKYYSGKVPEHTYFHDNIIKLAPDGNSATVLEEYTMPAMSSIPARNTLHLVKVNDKWMIDFISIAFVPKNEDVPNLEKALSRNSK